MRQGPHWDGHGRNDRLCHTEGGVRCGISRLAGGGLDFAGPAMRFGAQALGLRDPNGVRIALVAELGLDDDARRPVPAEHAVRDQEGGAGRRLAAPDADGPHRTLVFVRSAGGIVGRVAANRRGPGSQRRGDAGLKLGGHLFRDPSAAPLCIDQIGRHEVLDLGQLEEEAGGRIDQLLETNVDPQVHFGIRRRAAPFRASDDLANAKDASRAFGALLEDINPIADLSVTVCDPPPLIGSGRIGARLYAADQCA